MDDWTRRLRVLTIGLILSGALNISLGAALYVSRSQSERQIAGLVKKQVPPKEAVSCAQVMQQFRAMSYRELVALLTNREAVEEGYAKRDLALAALVAFHEFDIDRALPSAILERRVLVLPEGREVTLFPALDDERHQAILQFAYLEKWPLTFKGLWGCLKAVPRDPTLEEAFAATAPFAQLELLFQKTGASVPRATLIQLTAEAPAEVLDQFAREQAQMLDLSGDMRQRLLLAFLAYKSPTAAQLLVRYDSAMVQKKLDDAGLMALLSLLQPDESLKGFCASLAKSPRSAAVREMSRKLCPEVVVEVAAPVIRQHVVKDRENLWKIARLYKVKVEDLIRINRLEKDQVRPGMVLKVPDPSPPREGDGTSKAF